MNMAKQKVQYYFAAFSLVYKKANPTFFTSISPKQFSVSLVTWKACAGKNPRNYEPNEKSILNQQTGTFIIPPIFYFIITAF